MESIEQVVHAAFPQLTAALRRGGDEIIRKWDVAVRVAIPQMDRLTREEMHNSFPLNLEAIASALSSADPDDIASVLQNAPTHGTCRFYQNYGVTEVSQESRLLRAAIVLELEEQLGRPMSALEAAALHATLDVMLLQAVLALVKEKELHLRDAAERELKYLAFLSHDMGNNLNAIKLSLYMVREQLLGTQSSEAADIIRQAEHAIDETMGGMRQLLQHEQLRKSNATLNREEVSLHALLHDMAREFSQRAAAKGLGLEVEVEPTGVVETDRKLVAMVLRNLLGNAIKFSVRGRIQLGGQPSDGHWALWVSDQGPGIEPQQVGRIFEAFHRAGGLTEGVGLGLAIASQAASLLGARLTVESQPGVGSRFVLFLPARSAQANEV